MANDRHYEPGDYYQLDDLSGFKIRAKRSRRIPGGQTGGAVVAPERWEQQQPQDFVRGIVDDQTVPEPRPRQANQFTVLGSEVSAPSARGASAITVYSSRGFTVGMSIQIMLDSGVQFATGILGISGNTFTLASPLPATVGNAGLGSPIENMVLALTAAGAGTAVFVLNVPGFDLLGFNVLG